MVNQKWPDSLTHSLNEWQGHLWSCPGQQKRLSTLSHGQVVMLMLVVSVIAADDNSLYRWLFKDRNGVIFHLSCSKQWDEDPKKSPPRAHRASKSGQQCLFTDAKRRVCNIHSSVENHVHRWEIMWHALQESCGVFGCCAWCFTCELQIMIENRNPQFLHIGRLFLWDVGHCMITDDFGGRWEDNSQNGRYATKIVNILAKQLLICAVVVRSLQCVFSAF